MVSSLIVTARPRRTAVRPRPMKRLKQRDKSADTRTHERLFSRPLHFSLDSRNENLPEAYSPKLRTEHGPDVAGFAHRARSPLIRPFATLLPPRSRRGVPLAGVNSDGGSTTSCVGEQAVGADLPTSLLLTVATVREFFRRAFFA